jgi:thiol-disulfide isomerase/thioredoxin
MKLKFVLSIVVIIIIVIGLGVFMDKAQGPGKYDDFAKALKTQGAEFFGAFWCPHCQAQKAEFGTAKKYLPYIECSNPDQSQTPICKSEKIESYPTWRFADGIVIAAVGEPTICAVKPGVAGEPAVCTNASSAYTKTWVFPGYSFSIKSPTDPIRESVPESKEVSAWKFPPEATATGEVPLQFLAQQIKFTLPE